MDLTHFMAVLAGLHFICANPEVIVTPDDQQEAKGLYMHTYDNRNVISIKESAWNADSRNTILMHELLHCGLYEEREANGWPHPRSLDVREEMKVQMLTAVAMTQF
jgi:Zn-dependent peptidase ImmA (M78 family)